MYKIVVDAMGGDLGSSVIVEAINQFLEENKDVEITVAGKTVEWLSRPYGLTYCPAHTDLPVHQPTANQCREYRGRAWFARAPVHVVLINKSPILIHILLYLIYVE